MNGFNISNPERVASPPLSTPPLRLSSHLRVVSEKMAGGSALVTGLLVYVPLDSWRCAFILSENEKTLRSQELEFEHRYSHPPHPGTISPFQTSTNPQGNSQRVLKVELEVQPSPPNDRTRWQLSSSWRKLCTALIVLGKRKRREGYGLRPPKENLPV